MCRNVKKMRPKPADGSRELSFRKLFVYLVSLRGVKLIIGL